MERKLGKLAPKHDARTLKLARYMPIIPPPPVASDWTGAVEKPWRDFLNSTVGDCTIAAAGHMIMLWSANASDIYVPDDQAVLEVYSTISGYDGTEQTDTGVAELDVLKYWKLRGIAGHYISAFMAIDPKNREMVKAAIHLFGAIYVGVSMPDSWEGQLNNGEVWFWLAGDRPNPANGHALPIVAYYDEPTALPDAKSLTCITWGQKQRMTFEWFEGCCDEAYVILSPDWINGPNAPSALDLATLQNDLKAL
jgi:hypothetical protein